MLRVMWLALAASLAACGSKQPAPASSSPAVTRPAPPPDAGTPAPSKPLDQDLPRLAERSLALYQDVAKAFAAAGEDCAAAASKLGQLEPVYRDVVIANAKVLHDGRARALRAALEPHGDQFDFAARSIVQSPTMAKCSQDAAFEKAFDALLEAPP